MSEALNFIGFVVALIGVASCAFTRNAAGVAWAAVSTILWARFMIQ